MRRIVPVVLFVCSITQVASAAHAASTIFVPLPPCRIADTRVAGGPYINNRSFKVLGPRTDFSAQGGTA